MVYQVFLSIPVYEIKTSKMYLYFAHLILIKNLTGTHLKKLIEEKNIKKNKK